MPTVDEMRVVMDAETARLYKKLTEADRRMAAFQRATEQRLANFDAYFQRFGVGLGAITGALGTNEIIQYATAWARLGTRLEATQRQTGVMVTSSSRLVDEANRARMSVEDYATAYVDVVAALRDTAAAGMVAERVTTLLNQAVRVSIPDTSRHTEVVRAFIAALKDGDLDTKDFRDALRQTPLLVEALSRSLGVSQAQVGQWALNGKISAEQFVSALTGGAARIEREFSELAPTIEGAMARLKNGLTRYIGERDRATGGTRALAGAIDVLAGNIDNVADAALLAGLAMSAAFGPRMLASVGAMTAGMGRMAIAGLAAAGPLGVLAAVVGGSIGALALYGDRINVTADGMVNLHDVSLAALEVLQNKLTPFWEQATAAWTVAVNKITEALDGIGLSMDDVVAPVRAAINSIIGIHSFAAKLIEAAFLNVPPAIAEQFVKMANAVIATVERMVQKIIDQINVLPGIDITPKINLGRITNPLKGATDELARKLAEAGRQLGRDFVGEAGAAMDKIRREIMELARRNAELRRWRAGTSTTRPTTRLPGEKDDTNNEMKRKMEAAQKELDRLHKAALEAQGRFVDAARAEYLRDLAHFQDLLNKKLITQEQFEQARLDLARVAAKKIAEAAEKEFAYVRQAFDALGNNMSSAFDEFTKSGKVNFRELTRSILADIAKIAFKLWVLQPLLGGPSKGMGLLGNLLGVGGGVKLAGALAGGGPVSAGKTYLVGEQGPELFVPSAAGNIIPNGAAAAGGVGGQITVMVSASPELDAKIAATAQGVVVKNTPQIVGASLHATRRELPGLISGARQRQL